MFLEKAITKKINLLYYVDLFGPEIAVVDLMRFLTLSQNTIKKYIQEINETVEGYQMNYTDNIISVPMNQKKTGSLVTRELLEDSLNLRIFYRIFKYEHSLSELSDDLFLSKSAVLRKIKTINHYFNEHQLPIQIENSKHYQIVGDEKIIRKFLQVIFFETHDYDSLKTYKIVNLEVRRFIERHFLTRQTLYQSLSMESYLFVAMIRSAQGHLVYDSLEQVPHVLKEDVALTYQYFSQKIPVVKFIEQTLGVTYTPLYSANTIDVNLLETYHFYKEHNLTAEPIYKKLQALLTDYLAKYQVDFSLAEKEEFLLFLAKKRHLLGTFNQIFLRDFEAHFYYLKKVSAEKLDYIWSKVNQLQLFKSVEPSIMYEFVIYFILYNKDIRQNFFAIFEAQPKKILIYSSKQISIAEMIGLNIQDKYMDKTSLTIDYLTTLYEDIKIDDYDVIISDIYLDSFKEKYLYLSMIPNENFWLEFEERLKCAL